jgi:Domain of unknown function (DUF4386)
MIPTRTLVKTAGVLYLMVALCGMFAELYVRSGIVVPGDAAATAGNIRASATLFRLGFVVDLVQATCFLFTAMALYLLLRHVNRLVAAAMVTLVAVSVAIMCLNLLNSSSRCRSPPTETMRAPSARRGPTRWPRSSPRCSTTGS